MIENIIEELTTELQNEVDFNVDILRLKVNNAYREVKQARNYPSSYTDSMKEADMENFYTNVKAIALYDYNKVGAEGQTQYSADGESIHYVDRNKMFAGILPIART
jgi:hypothetical protein